jgi:hypothetical protein
MQDFALNVSKCSYGGISPNNPINLASFTGLNGKVEIWKGK